MLRLTAFVGQVSGQAAASIRKKFTACMWAPYLQDTLSKMQQYSQKRTLRSLPQLRCSLRT